MVRGHTSRNSFLVVLTKKNANGKTPLHIAAEKGNIDAIKVLLNNNAVTNIKDALGRFAAECGKITAYNMISNHKPGPKKEYITVDDDDEDEKGAKKVEPAKPVVDTKKPAVVDDKKKKK